MVDIYKSSLSFYPFLFPRPCTNRKDATLKEIMDLVKEVNPEARRRGTIFKFAIIFPNMMRGMYLVKEIGTTRAGDEKGPDDNVTLQSKKFQIGDFIDIAISTPR